MTKKIDELGRVVLPAEMRLKLAIGKEDSVNLECDGKTIIISKAEPDCRICHSTDHELLSINNSLVCSECIKKIKSL